MASSRLSAVIAGNDSSMRDTAELIERIKAELRPLRRCTLQSRRQLDESHRLLREVGTPWRFSDRADSS